MTSTNTSETQSTLQSTMYCCQNPNSPYYLHPGENPGLILVSPQLNDTNYHCWSRSMRRALMSKNKMKFVDGSTDVPQPDDHTFEAWERCNVMILSWITRTLSPQIAESTIYIDIAKQLWDDLKERFRKGDHFRISDLLQEVHSIKQGERSVTQVFTDIKTLWEELESFRPLSKCNCGSQQYRDSEYVICFLKGLGEIYSTVKTQILLMEPLPNINKVFSLVIQ